MPGTLNLKRLAKLPIGRRAVFARVNRRLAKDQKQLRRVRGAYCQIDLRRNVLLDPNVDLEKFAHRRSVQSLLGKQWKEPTMTEANCSKQDAREGLARHFRSMADFLKCNPEEHVEVSRDIRSIDSLGCLADHCLGLADDNPLLDRLLSLPDCFAENGDFRELKITIIDTAGRQIFTELGRSGTVALACNFDGETEAPGFFAFWVSILEKDYLLYTTRMREFAGGDLAPTGVTFRRDPNRLKIERIEWQYRSFRIQEAKAWEAASRVRNATWYDSGFGFISTGQIP